MLTPRRIIVLSVLLAGGFWLAGAALDAWVFLEGSYSHELLHPDLQSTCLRSLAILVILATGLAWSRHGRQNEAVRQDLAATASNYRRLVDATPDCVMVHAGDRPLFANRRALEFLGFPDLAALGNQSVEDLVHPDDRPVVAARLRSLGEAAAEDEPVEVRVRRRGGETADVLAHGTPIRYDGRDAVLTVFRDITAEVETRRELEASRERLSLALEAARDGVWDWDI
ncbi:MAG: PAS domain S-box protein, partial [Synechococcaceae cyanobacterium]|nr:PAS domain S-box protein [Synechococcaceae cyanobacterium]